MKSMRKYQKGYTVVELLMVLWMLFVGVLGIAFVGTIIWGIYRLVTHFT
ncbi:major head protein [Xanthomonas phage Xoo-sp13]|nr:major head protein [Xanthomonas phage Xoo-sp13]